MVNLHSVLVFSHIVVGSAALVLFWVPIATKKGSRLHVKAGKVYVASMYFVAISAFAASILVLVDPLTVRAPEVATPEEGARLAARYRMFSLFLLMLSILVFASLRQGIVALRARRDVSLLRAPLHRAVLIVLGVTSLVVAYLGLREMQVLLIVFGVIGAFGSIGMLRDTFLSKPRPVDFVYMHLNGLIGSGIGAYTAFFAFGGARFLSDVLIGQWQTLAWVTPAIIGTVAIRRQRRKYAA